MATPSRQTNFKAKRIKLTPAAKAKTLAAEFANESLIYDDGKLICRSCITQLAIKKSQVIQHLKSMKHGRSKELKTKQQFISESSSQQTFKTELCQAFTAANIPLSKLSNDVFRTFMEKYIGRTLPHHTTLRNSYLENAYNNVIDIIRNDIGEGPLWVSIDETTDDLGRYIANVIVGKLDPEEEHRSYLFDTQVLTKTNHQTIIKLFNEALHLLWPHGILYENVLLLVSDAAAYMVKAGNCLKEIYPRLTHTTCMAHGLHRVCETIRDLFPCTNSFISSMKKVFKKAPSRVQKFKELCPNIPLPPSPICTRWGTWLEAVKYYATYLEDLKRVLNEIPDDSVAVRQSKVLAEKPELVIELAKISQHYVFIAEKITKLEKAGAPLSDSVAIVEDVVKRLLQAPDKAVKDKMADILAKNAGLKALSAVAMFDSSKIPLYPQFSEMTPIQLASFKFAPIVSVDVERSFSIYKQILTDNRKSFEFENLRYHFIICCNRLPINS